MKKYIFLDVDGTLLDTNTKEIPASAIEAIKLAQNNGHKVYLCSGRTILEMKPFLHLELDGYICAAGGQIHQDNQIIFDYTFAKEDVTSVSALQHLHAPGRPPYAEKTSIAGNGLCRPRDRMQHLF